MDGEQKTLTVLIIAIAAVLIVFFFMAGRADQGNRIKTLKIVETCTRAKNPENIRACREVN